MSSQQIYWGEKECSAIVKSTNTKCNNKAYYIEDAKILCGVHSKKDKRTTLDKNPDRDKIEQERINSHIEMTKKIAKENRINKKLGKVIVSKLRMMQKPDLYEGFINVFPNFKHQNRKDGYGCSSLSPMSLGPVKHNMPGLPDAKNLENYYQSAKVWKFELDDEGNINDEYFQRRIKVYNEKTAYRHKYTKKELLENGANKIPEYSVYYDKEGNPHKYDYLNSRYFYCKFYETLVKDNEDLEYLKQKIKKGYNLNIVGYDGYKPEGSYMDMYKDTSKPFGHEMVLYVLLTEDDPSKYPWNQYYNDNKKIYEGVI